MIRSSEKRSMRLSGHRTSVALEPLFWAALEQLAFMRGVSVPTLCAMIDNTRLESQSLASALRCAALQYAIDTAQKAQRVAA